MDYLRKLYYFNYFTESILYMWDDICSNPEKFMINPNYPETYPRLLISVKNERIYQLFIL